MHFSFRARSRSLRRGLVVLAAGPLIAGCGGSSHKSASTPASTSAAGAPSSTLDPPFRARAQSVCSQSAAAFKKLPPFPYPTFDPVHPDVSKLPAIARYFARNSLPVFTSTDRALRALGQPTRGQAGWSRFLSAEGTNLATFERQIATAKRSDSAGFVATVRQLSGGQVSAAQAIGLPACGMV